MSTTNFYFNSLGHYGEQNLIEDLIVESIKIYGIDCYYMPRTIVNEDLLFGEDTLSKFEDAYPLEMYIKSVNGFEGDGTFLSKFGLEIRDEMVLSVAQRRFGEEISYDDTTKEAGRPVEGDLIFFPLNNKIYEVKFVEHEVVFYQMGKLQTYDLTCELFEYSSERIDTGIQAIDAIEEKYSIADQNVRISLETYLPIGDAVAIVVDAIISGTTIVNQSASQPNNYVPNIGIADPTNSPVTAVGNVVLSYANTIGFLSDISISNSGFGYNSEGNYLGNSAIVIESPAVGFGKFDDHCLNVTNDSYKFSNATLKIDYSEFEQNEKFGYVSMWVYANSLPSESISPAGLFKTGGDDGVSSANYRKIVGIDNLGRIVESRENSGSSAPEVLTTDSVISTNNWIHIAYAIDDVAGSESKQRIWANGVLKLDRDVGTEYQGITGIRSAFFGTALDFTHYAGTDSEVSVSKLDGFVDEIHINSNTQTLYSDPSNPSFDVPTSRVVKNANTVYINTFTAATPIVRLVANTETLTVNNVIVSYSGNGYYDLSDSRFNTRMSYSVTFPTANTRTAVLSANMTDDKLSSITIAQPGFGYLPDERPKITINPVEDPEGGRLVFEDGTTIQSESVRLEDADSSANNEYFTQQAGSDAYDTTFIDFTDQNPFSEGENW